MYGSYFFNCWGALIGFTVAFILKITQPFAMPLPSILSSLIWAAVAFITMYAIRYFLGFVFYTPSEIEFDDELEALVEVEQKQKQILPNDLANSAELSDESSEEVAKVVRTMLHKDNDAPKSNVS